MILSREWREELEREKFYGKLRIDQSDCVYNRRRRESIVGREVSISKRGNSTKESTWVDWSQLRRSLGVKEGLFQAHRIIE